MSRRRRSTYRRPAPRSSGAGLACLLAFLALGAAMGVVVWDERMPAPKPKPTAAAVVVPELIAPEMDEPQPRAPRPQDPLKVLKRRIAGAEKRMPEIRAHERGPGFERARIELLSEITEIRDKLGLLLDERPNSDRVSRLWDRALRLLAALRKF